jgi:hypothetical protein
VRFFVAVLVLAGPFAAAASAATFQDGDLYLATNGYQNFGQSVARIDPVTGQDFLVADLPWPTGAPIRAGATYCRFRDRLVLIQATPTGGLHYLDADGTLTQPFPTILSPYALAARGDGILYLFNASDTFRYVAADETLHDLMDETGTQPFHLGASGAWDELFYEPSTNSLFVANGDASGFAGCADGNMSCIVKIPLSADGTQVAGSPVSLQIEVIAGTLEDNVVGSGLTDSGSIAFTIDTNSNNQNPRMQLVDPVTMTAQIYASNGSYIGAAATGAGTFSNVRGQWVIRDWLNNVLRAFSPGEVGLGTVITTLGPTFTGSVARLIEIDRGDDPTPVVTMQETATGVGLTAWPSPFTGSVSVSFELPRPSRVRVTVHDAAGRSLRALADGDRSVGRHFATWDGADASGRPVASGVYFVRMESNGGATETRRIVRLR